MPWRDPLGERARKLARLFRRGLIVPSQGFRVENLPDGRQRVHARNLPPPAAACCFPDGSCRLLSPTDCANAGGTYLGANTFCSPNPCPCCEFHIAITLRFYGSLSSNCHGENITWDCTSTHNFRFTCISGFGDIIELFRPPSCTTCSGLLTESECDIVASVRVSNSPGIKVINYSLHDLFQSAVYTGVFSHCTDTFDVDGGVSFFGSTDEMPDIPPTVFDSWCNARGIHSVTAHLPISQFVTDGCLACDESVSDQVTTGDFYWEITVVIS